MFEFPFFKSIKLFLISFYYAYRIHAMGLLTGIMFGFLMSHAGATTYDFHAKMFLFIDFQLMEVIGTAVLVAMVGVFLLKRYHVNAIATGCEVDFVKKPYQAGLITGAFLFGIGWAMTASCPGTIPAMIGEGKIGAVFALIGIVGGTMAYGVLQGFIYQKKLSENESTQSKSND